MNICSPNMNIKIIKINEKLYKEEYMSDLNLNDVDPIETKNGLML